MWDIFSRSPETTRRGFPSLIEILRHTGYGPGADDVKISQKFSESVVTFEREKFKSVVTLIGESSKVLFFKGEKISKVVF